MSKLVDKERLARLAAALDARAKAAVQAEKERAMGVEQGLQDAINAINHGTNGILAQAKTYVNSEIDKVEEAMQQADGALEDRIQGLETSVNGADGLANMKQNIANNKAAIDKLNGADTVDGSVAKQVKVAKEAVQAEVQAEKERAMGVEQSLRTDVDAMKHTTTGILAQAKGYVDEKVGGLKTDIEGQLEEEVEGLGERIDGVQGEVDAVEERVGVAEGKIGNLESAVNKLNGGKEVEGSVDYKIDKEIERVNSITGNLGGVVEEIQGDVAEIQGAIGVDGTDATGIYKKIKDGDAATLAAAKEHAEGHVSAKIAELIDSAPEAMNTLNELAEAIKGNKDVYDGYVAEHATAMAKMKTDLQAEIDADVKVEKEAREAAVSELQGQVDLKLNTSVYEAKMGQIDTKQGEQDTAIQKAQQDATKAQQEVDAVELRVGTLEGEMDAVEAAVAANKTDIEGKLTAAINKEVGDRNAAIEAALEPFSTTEEVKAILGNVVSTLNLSITGDKVVLKLGGAEGISLSEVSLDMATDADIDEIINGLN